MVKRPVHAPTTLCRGGSKIAYVPPKKGRGEAEEGNSKGRLNSLMRKVIDEHHPCYSRLGGLDFSAGSESEGDGWRDIGVLAGSFSIV